MQCLFEGSEEALGIQGLGVFPGTVRRFSNTNKAVPHMGWHRCATVTSSNRHWISPEMHYYFVHSYAVPYKGIPVEEGVVAATCQYGEKLLSLPYGKGISGRHNFTQKSRDKQV